MSLRLAVPVDTTVVYQSCLTFSNFRMAGTLSRTPTPTSLVMTHPGAAAATTPRTLPRSRPPSTDKLPRFARGESFRQTPRNDLSSLPKEPKKAYQNNEPVEDGWPSQSGQLLSHHSCQIICLNHSFFKVNNVWTLSHCSISVEKVFENQGNMNFEE